MQNRIIGSILMIMGTAIGAGMLALPVAAAQENYLVTILLLIICWAAMTLGALALLEVNLWMQPNTNLITMANNTLGKLGKYFSWIIYLLLLYSLLCAYLSGAGDILQALLSKIHLYLPRFLSTILALILLGSIVYRGVSSIDIVNRLLMGTKLLAYIILVVSVAKHIHLEYLTQGNYKINGSTVMVMLTSFGYAIIIPSLRNYLQSNIKHLKQVVLIGSCLPLIIYLLWILVIQGSILRTGDLGLITMLHSANTNSLLITSISNLTNNLWIKNLVTLFISICAVTSFLGVSLSIIDFIADGINKNKTGKDSIIVYSIAYLPPLLLVILAPGIFIKALSYAGICCVLLLIILPLAMLYSGRYYRKYQGTRIVKGGKIIILMGIVFGAITLIL